MSDVVSLLTNGFEDLARRFESVTAGSAEAARLYIRRLSAQAAHLLKNVADAGCGQEFGLSNLPFPKSPSLMEGPAEQLQWSMAWRLFCEVMSTANPHLVPSDFGVTESRPLKTVGRGTFRIALSRKGTEACPPQHLGESLRDHAAACRAVARWLQQIGHRRQLSRKHRKPGKRPKLTDRQQSAYALKKAGLSNKEIAARLGVSKGAAREAAKKGQRKIGIEEQHGRDRHRQLRRSKVAKSRRPIRQRLSISGNEPTWVIMLDGVAQRTLSVKSIKLVDALLKRTEGDSLPANDEVLKYRALDAWRSLPLKVKQHVRRPESGDPHGTGYQLVDDPIDQSE